MKKTRKNKKLEPRSDSIVSEMALGPNEKPRGAIRVVFFIVEKSRARRTAFFISHALMRQNGEQQQRDDIG
ncbi:MAG: hypothetical protein ACLPIC_18080, partial [Rhodoblastus sp.]|uniref:hypothetical protein n=1 Tax=Rhodoblastus sp. TaxID=1962975 RepID=UPI003F9D1408